MIDTTCFAVIHSIPELNDCAQRSNRELASRWTSSLRFTRMHECPAGRYFTKLASYVSPSKHWKKVGSVRLMPRHFDVLGLACSTTKLFRPLVKDLNSFSMHLTTKRGCKQWTSMRFLYEKGIFAYTAIVTCCGFVEHLEHRRRAHSLKREHVALLALYKEWRHVLQLERGDLKEMGN